MRVLFAAQVAAERSVVLAALALTLEGCASTWFYVETGVELESVRITRHATQASLERACNRVGINACYDPRSLYTGHCKVHMGPYATNCSLRHELAGHCAGWRHAGPDGGCGPTDGTT